VIIEVVLIVLLLMITTGISTITGFGTSTISIPILLNFFPFHQTLLFVGIIHLAGTIGKMILFKHGFSRNLLIKLAVPGVIASFIGAQTTFLISSQVASSLLGGFLIVYVSLILAYPAHKLPQTLPVTIAGATCSGFFAGLFGLGGAIRSAFLSAFDFKKSTYLFTTNFAAFLIDIARLSTYISGGMSISTILWWATLFSIPGSLLGAFFAKKIVDFIPQKRFRMVVGSFLGFAGLKLLLFP